MLGSLVKYLWIALGCAMLHSCRKAVADPHALLSKDEIYYESSRPSMLFPTNGAELIDLNTEIIIYKNAMTPQPIGIREMFLESETEIVLGKIIEADQKILFYPEKELSPLTRYTVQAKLIFKPAANDDRQISVASRNSSSDFAADTVQQLLSWKFKTMGSYRYVMRKTSDMPTDFVRDGNKLMQMGDQLYSYGGWTAEPLLSYNDIYKSDGDLSTWTRLPDAPWEGRHTYGIGKIDSTLYIYGGDHLSTVFDVWKTTDGFNFTEVRQDLNSVLGPRIVYGSCTHNSKLYVLGGQRGVGNNVPLTDVWVSSTGSFWKRIANNLTFLGKNISGCVASFKGRIWVIGGGYYREDDYNLRYTKEIFSSEDGQNWRREPDGPWEARQYADVCVWNNRLWMIGGYNERNLQDIWYMTEDGTWHEFDTPEEFLPRHASGVAVYNDKLVIVCGNYHNDSWVIEKN